MAGISHNCPHCGTQQAYFDFLFQKQFMGYKNHWHIFAVCNVCHDSVIVLMMDFSKRGHDPINAAQNGELLDYFHLKRVLPESPSPRIPASIPANVETPLSEAEQSFASGLYSAAGSCYRKAVERALKAIDPELTGMLNRRIRTLEKNGLLPHSMIELLDQVRLFGNSSMHEADLDPTKEDCAAAREFCILFLTYAFTLPAKVENAKSTTQAGED